MASGQWEGGKGSNQRKASNQKQFDNNWDAIFGKKNKPSAVDDCATAKAESAANEKQNSVSKKSS
jgi:hypothetical protein